LLVAGYEASAPNPPLSTEVAAAFQDPMLDKNFIFIAAVFALAGFVKGVIGLGLPTKEETADRVRFWPVEFGLTSGREVVTDRGIKAWYRPSIAWA
jgi:hypothetical protein